MVNEVEDAGVVSADPPEPPSDGAEPLALSDRMLLGQDGLSLSDAEYAQAVAAMGLRHSPESAFFPSSSRRVDFRESRIGPRWDRERMLEAAAAWRRAIGVAGEFVIAVFPSRRHDTRALLRVLSHPAVGAAAVTVNLDNDGFDEKWQWPLRISRFADEAGALDLSALGGDWPARELSELGCIDRDRARVELLVFHGGVRDALLRVLALPYRVRASHVLLIAPPDTDLNEASDRLRTLAMELQAGAVSLLSAEPEQIGGRLNEFIRELSHDAMYAAAVNRAFADTGSVHFMVGSLPASRKMRGLAASLSNELAALPPAAELRLENPAMIADQIGIAPTAAAPALGRALRGRRGSMSFDSESRGASALKSIARAGREARRELAAEEAPRYLQADLDQIGVGERRGRAPDLRDRPRWLVVGRNYRLDVLIAPTGEAQIQASEWFDESRLEWVDDQSLTLQVMFAEPGQWPEPMLGRLHLPRTGASNRCRFLFRPTQAGAFSGRVTVYHRGRVVQTALLQCQVYAQPPALETADAPPLMLRVEAELRRSLGTLDDRRRFDACLILNHAASGKATMTAAGKNGAYIRSLDAVRPTLATINSLISQVAHDSKAFAKGLRGAEGVRLLSELATEGRVLYDGLVQDYLFASSAAEDLRNAEYMQIVSTRPDDPIPLEFVYDFPAPVDNASLCPHALKALEKGQCDASCKAWKSQAEGKHVCPMGLWGLSRVIERHQMDASLVGEAKVLAEPFKGGGRDELSISGNILLAASNNVAAAERKRLQSKVAKAWKGKGAAKSVDQWEQWVAAVKEQKPVVLLALPHAGGSGSGIFLEIGGDQKKSVYINETYVLAEGAKRPLVILFGCDTLNTGGTESYARHVAVFRRHQAALVLGTIATVLGKDAADVAATLVAKLVDTAQASGASFGEVLRATKRRALIDDQLVALCLVAFGDADWRLT
ncbi:hypothetical protein [Pseudomonas sp. CGJS7]|uniref:hypothetical protein n=1 Tax=Pseudomonas sp. CGJS7 TaxID=3109348 RepID=UPI003007FA98